MFFATTVLLLAAAASTVRADHLFTVNNHCGGSETAHVKSSAFNDVSGSLGSGGSYSASVPTTATSMIVFGENGECPGVDGPGCTRLECDFSNPSFQQCNLSRVAGYNIPLSFSWSDGGCSGATCGSSTCPPSDAWNPDSNDGSSIRQCNTANVGVTLNLCG